jgi:hypothetical protein
MELLRQLYAKLRLRINESKSAVAPATQRDILGYALWIGSGRTVRRRVADKALLAMKNRIRSITKRNGGRSISRVCEELRTYLLGWKNYFVLADTPRIFERLDSWIRHRLRAIHLKHWKQGPTVYRELRVRGLSDRAAKVAAAHAHRWWHTSRLLINGAFPTRYFDQLGVPRLIA